MPGGIVAKNDFADRALVFGEMSFFDQTIIGIVFILQDKSKLFLWPKNFSTKKSSALIQIPSNFFAQLAIFARGGGDGFVIGRIGFVNGARAIGVEDDTDANLAVFFLRESAARSDCDAEEKGKNEAAHDVLVGRGKVEGKAGEEKAKLRVEGKVDRPLRRAMSKYGRRDRQIDSRAKGIVFGRCLTLSLTPCFSWVLTTAWDNLNRFSGFLSVKEETAKAVVVADSGHAPR
jgi:hypothetical protein